MPTAKQLVVLVHDTPDSLACVGPGGFGLATIVQLVPFHRSTKVRLVVPTPGVPTAKQLVALAHDTPDSTLPFGSDVFGLDTIVQLVPFHRSTKVRRTVDAKLPTA